MCGTERGEDVDGDGPSRVSFSLRLSPPLCVTPSFSRHRLIPTFLRAYTPSSRSSLLPATPLLPEPDVRRLADLASSFSACTEYLCMPSSYSLLFIASPLIETSSRHTFIQPSSSVRCNAPLPCSLARSGRCMTLSSSHPARCPWPIFQAPSNQSTSQTFSLTHSN